MNKILKKKIMVSKSRRIKLNELHEGLFLDEKRDVKLEIDYVEVDEIDNIKECLFIKETIETDCDIVLDNTYRINDKCRNYMKLKLLKDSVGFEFMIRLTPLFGLIAESPIKIGHVEKSATVTVKDKLVNIHVPFNINLKYTDEIGNKIVIEGEE